MKIDYEGKQVTMRWTEFGGFSKKTQMELLGKAVVVRKVEEEIKKGKSGDFAEEEKTILYSGKGICIKFAKKSMSVKEFYSLLPMEVIAYEVNQDLFNAIETIKNSESEEIEMN